MGKLNDAINIALSKPSLLDALSFIAIWEHERSIESDTGETCFRLVFEKVLSLHNDSSEGWHNHG